MSKAKIVKTNGPVENAQFSPKHYDTLKHVDSELEDSGPDDFLTIASITQHFAGTPMYETIEQLVRAGYLTASKNGVAVAISMRGKRAMKHWEQSRRPKPSLDARVNVVNAAPPAGERRDQEKSEVPATTGKGRKATDAAPAKTTRSAGAKPGSRARARAS